MNIIAVIVDEVPETCAQCEHGYPSYFSATLKRYKQYGCFKFKVRTISSEEAHEKRNPDCPLMTAAQYAERVYYEQQLQDDMQREDQMREERKKLEREWENEQMRGEK